MPLALRLVETVKNSGVGQGVRVHGLEIRDERVVGYASRGRVAEEGILAGDSNVLDTTLFLCAAIYEVFSDGCQQWATIDVHFIRSCACRLPTFFLSHLEKMLGVGLRIKPMGRAGREKQRGWQGCHSRWCW